MSARASQTSALPSQLLSVRGERRPALNFCSNPRILVLAPLRLLLITTTQRNQMMIVQLWILKAHPRELTKRTKAHSNNQTRMQIKTQPLLDIKRLNLKNLWGKYSLQMRINSYKKLLANKMTLNGRTLSAYRHA